MGGIRLSEIVMSRPEDLKKILGKPIVDTSGQQVGIVDTVILRDSGAISHVTVRRGDGICIELKADNLVLDDNMLILYDPPTSNILYAAKEISKALLELIELYSDSQENSQNYKRLLKTAREHLNNAISLLDYT